MAGRRGTPEAHRELMGYSEPDSVMQGGNAQRGDRKIGGNENPHGAHMNDRARGQRPHTGGRAPFRGEYVGHDSNHHTEAGDGRSGGRGSSGSY